MSADDNITIPQFDVVDDLRHFEKRNAVLGIKYGFVPRELLGKAADTIEDLREDIRIFKELQIKHIRGDFEDGKADVTLLLKPHPLMALLVESLRQFVGEAPNYQAVEVSYGTPGETFVVTVVRPHGKRPEQRNIELMGYLDDVLDDVDLSALGDKATDALSRYSASRPLPNCNAHLKEQLS